MQRLALVPHLALLLGVLSGACASEPLSGVEWKGTEAQWTGGFYTAAVSPQLWVLVVDDAPTERARALRAEVASELADFWDDWRADTCTRKWDSAQHWPQRIHVLLIPSSDPTAALHAGLRPELDLHTPNVGSATAGAWEVALAEAIVGLESEEERPNLVLAGLAYWGELLDGARAPAGPAEEAFLAGLSQERWTTVVSIGTRDDESATLAEEFSLAAFSAIGRDAKLDAVCERSEGAGLAPRLDQVLGVTCGGPYLRSNLACKLAPICQGRWPLRLENGQVACRATVYIEETASCAAEAGWLDPLDEGGSRYPRWVIDPVDTPPGRYRECEIRQLEGASQAACETDFECAGCEPGFCFRHHFEEQQADYLVGQCASRGTWSTEQFRFVLGAGSAHFGWGTLRCDLDSMSDP